MDSQRMVIEAYARIYNPSTIVDRRPKHEPWATTRIAIEQMWQSGLISKHEMMKQLTTEWNNQ